MWSFVHYPALSYRVPTASTVEERKNDALQTAVDLVQHLDNDVENI